MAKFNIGHFRSQKFAALVFCVAVLGALAFFLADAVFSTLTMGVVALYTAFVGGRAWSDGQALKFGGAPGDTAAPKPVQPATTVVKKIVTPPKEDPREVD